MAYTKKALKKSLKYANVADILEVVLENDKCYTFEEVDVAVDKFLNPKKKVKKTKGKVSE